MPEALKTFDAANRWLKGRVNVVNNLDSEGLSKALPPKVRAACFFSAKVAEARVIERIRRVSDLYSRNRISLDQARVSLKKYLAAEGYDPNDQGRGDGRLSNLTSTARINLILRTNARMAAAVGQREVDFDPDMLERWPFYRYLPSTSINKRDSHTKFYNLVLPKDDPFWNTHTPPLDFGCKCGIEAIDAEEAGEFGGVDESPELENGVWTGSINGREFKEAEVPPSGFVFDVSQAFEFNDMGRLREPWRAAVVSDIVRAVAKGDLGRITLLGAAPKNAAAINAPDLTEAMLALEKLVDPASKSLDAAGVLTSDLDDFRKVTAKYKAAGISPFKIPADVRNAFPEGGIGLGDLPDGHAAALGLPKNISIRLSRGNEKYGLAHNWRHHKKSFIRPSTSVSIFEETIFNPGARAAMTIRQAGGVEPRTVVALHNPATKAFTVLEIKGNKAELLSWHRPDEAYTVKEWALEDKEKGDQ